MACSPLGLFRAISRMLPLRLCETTISRGKTLKNAAPLEVSQGLV